MTNFTYIMKVVSSCTTTDQLMAMACWAIRVCEYEYLKELDYEMACKAGFLFMGKKGQLIDLKDYRKNNE